MIPATNASRHDATLPASFHEAFLARAAGAPDSRAKARALGGFLTLRLVDQFARCGTDSINPEALEYQTKATSDFIGQLYPRTAEVNHLAEIARVASGAVRAGTMRTLWPPMLAFAYWLEQETRLEEALDVLETALRLSDGRAGEEEVATQLQRARVLRRAGQFEEATDRYAAAGAMAMKLGDRHSEILSRIGHAVVLQKLGNLPESERMLREVLNDARDLQDRDAEARACHDLAAALILRERSSEAAPFAYRAFELYEQPAPKARALSDTGCILKELGHYSAAKDALQVVLNSAPPTDIRLRAELEMLDISALMGDRLSFERSRRELLAHVDSMPPDVRVDFAMKVGTGLAALEFPAEAQAELEDAVRLAERSGLSESLFRAERLLREVRERPYQPEAAPSVTESSPEVEWTIRSIKNLREMVEATAAS